MFFFVKLCGLRGRKMSLFKEFKKTSRHLSRQQRHEHNKDAPILRTENLSMRYESGSALEEVSFSLQEGERIAKELKKSGEFPQDMVQMISVGEETGKLGHMLNKISGFYDNAVGYSLKKFIALIEPVFIIVLGILVGFIMASMLLPMFDMIKAISR